MSDRELLELAAKAAGIQLVWGGPEKDMPRRTDTLELWSPLDSNGEALRLAVKLHIGLSFTAASTRIPAKIVARFPRPLLWSRTKDTVIHEGYVPEEMFTSNDIRFGESDRRYAEYYVRNYEVTVGVMPATRRAIVRAAAEIGRQMQEGGAE